MITKDDIATYRATYPPKYWEQKAKELGFHCSSPLGAVFAVNALCDAYEALERELETERRLSFRDQVAELENERDTAWAQAHRLALELECLLMDTKDSAVMSKWWDSGMEALSEYQEPQPGAAENAEAWAAIRKAGI